MAPDLNSLPPSSPVTIPFRNMTIPTTSANGSGEYAIRGDSPSASPRSASLSLQAAATMNASLQHEPSRRMSLPLFPPLLGCKDARKTNVFLFSAHDIGTSIGSLSHQRRSPQAGRRRSVVLMNLQHNDPSVPAPGEMLAEGSRTRTPQSVSASPRLTGRDPLHNRAPSLGELHQELEAEQEAQVVKMPTPPFFFLCIY